jgi:hypothetical protein
MQLIAIHIATIQLIHGLIFPLSDGGRCLLRMLHEHANELTTTQIIHVAREKATWHCIHVVLNAYRKTSPARCVATSSITRKQHSWHDWKCNHSKPFKTFMARLEMQPHAVASRHV